MAELVQSQNGSSSVVQQASSSNSSSAFFSSSSSSSFSASSSSSSSTSSSSSSTKVVKQSVTTVQQSSSSSTSSSSTMMSSSSSSSSKQVSIQSSGLSYSDRLAVDLGIADISKEMDRLQLRLGDEMTNIHRDIFRLMPASPEVQTAAVDGSTTTTTTTGAGGLEQFLVKMDSDAIRSCIDKAHDDRVKLNFDVNEFDSETINIRTVGNKIEVHAMKKSKKGDEERSEEFSRVYELPNELDPSHVTSSIYKDGVLTIELPVSDALGPSQ